MVEEEFILVGGSSDIAQKFYDICIANNIRTTVITSNKEKAKNIDNSFLVHDYLKDYEKILKKIIDKKNIIVIFFNGVLYENRPSQFPTQNQQLLTTKINFLIPYNLCKKLNNDYPGESKFVFISTMAAIKPRYKNYLYGLSKFSLEESIKKLALPNFLIIRFGKVTTKMSEGHDFAPFTLTPEEAAGKLFSKVKKRGIKYPNFGLLLISILIKFLPKRISDKF